MSDEARDVEKDVNEGEKKSDPDRIVRNHVLVSMGVGLIPIPILDLAGLAGVQLNMLRKLAKNYDVPFSRDIGKHVIGSLTGGGVSVPVGGGLASLVKCIPLVGSLAGLAAMPAAGGAATYAVGKVFIQHFESGGTFLSFDPEKVRAYYAEMFKEGEKVSGDAA